ncbi:MAG: TIGR00282 family metallophosphoesterase [Pirellulaceae bacterium]
MNLRLLFIGDIVGKTGLEIVTETIPGLRRQQSIDAVIANGENADCGSGITPAIYRKLLASGVDCVTLGDHIYRKKDIIDVLQKSDRVVKPANFPAEAPGRAWTVFTAGNGQKVAVFSLMGRVFMKPVDCPFRAADRVLAEIPDDVPIRVVDFHAEATSDKYLMGRYLDGRVSGVLGTHTHVPTADEQIFPGGTGFQCDVGMTGPHNSILGRQIENVLQATLTFEPIPFAVAKTDNRINGAILEIDGKTGRCLKITRLMIDEKTAGRIADDDDENDR